MPEVGQGNAYQSYTTQYLSAFLQYVEDEYCAKHRRVPVNITGSIPSSNFVPSVTTLGSCQSPFDPYDVCSDADKYVMPNNVAETTPGQSNCAAHLQTATRLYCNAPPKAPKDWGQIKPNPNGYHSDPMVISSTFWLPDITNCLRQQETIHSKYDDHSNVASSIFSIIPHGDGAQANFSYWRDVNGWRQSITTGEALCKKGVVRQIASANIGIWQGDGPALDAIITQNDSEMKQVVEEWKLHRKVKIHDILEMWQGSQNLCATQNKSRA